MPKAKSTDPNAERFGAIVSELRTQRGWTLEDLGKASGMSADWLGVLEKGLNTPSLNTILRLARAFEVSAASIVQRIEDAAG